jgi:hypothetical protein
MSLSNAHLRVDALRPAAGAGLWRSVFRRATIADDLACQVELPMAGGRDALPALLDLAAARLRSRLASDLRGLPLEVQLGLEHAHFGLLALEDGGAGAPRAAMRDTYAQAWVRQMLHLDPAAQVVRWQVSPDGRKLLISCVDRQVFDALQAFSDAQGLRFVSCRPAVLSAVSAVRAPAAAGDARGLTVVWTEAGRHAARFGSVQLLRFEQGLLSATWRGWVPAAACAGLEPDEALAAAVRRFGARAATPGITQHVHWPSAPASNFSGA